MVTAELEVGEDILQAVLSEEKAPDITLRLVIRRESGSRVMEKTVASSQALMYLGQMRDEGAPKELAGWNDITLPHLQFRHLIRSLTQTIYSQLQIPGGKKLVIIPPVLLIWTTVFRRAAISG